MGSPAELMRSLRPIYWQCAAGRDFELKCINTDKELAFFAKWLNQNSAKADLIVKSNQYS